MNFPSVQNGYGILWFLKNVGLGTGLGSVFDGSRSLVFASIELCFASRSLEFSV